MPHRDPVGESRARESRARESRAREHRAREHRAREREARALAQAREAARRAVRTADPVVAAALVSEAQTHKHAANLHRVAANLQVQHQRELRAAEP